jgi:hypothetical protein
MNRLAWAFLFACLMSTAWAQTCTGVTITSPPQAPYCIPSQTIPTITVSGTTTTITGDVVITGGLSVGAAGKPTAWTVIRSDGKVCSMTFQPANPDTTSTVVVIKCP